MEGGQQSVLHDLAGPCHSRPAIILNVSPPSHQGRFSRIARNGTCEIKGSRAGSGSWWDVKGSIPPGMRGENSHSKSRYLVGRDETAFHPLSENTVSATARAPALVSRSPSENQEETSRWNVAQASCLHFSGILGRFGRQGCLRYKFSDSLLGHSGVITSPESESTRRARK